MTFEFSDISPVLSALFAMVGLIFAGLQLHSLKKQEHLKYKQKTLDYVTYQFDRLAEIKAREEMAKTGETDILPYLKGLSEDKTVSEQDLKIIEQRLLEYVYVFNRIGAGIYNGSLDKDVIFNLWAPQFFMKHWGKYKGFIIEKRKYNSNAYVFFDWLANECIKHNDTYPKVNARHYS